jgi:hypothetical protein
MGIFTDFYVGDRGEIEAAFSWIGSGPEGDGPGEGASIEAFNEWLMEGSEREPSDVERARMKRLDSLLEYKGVMSTCVAALRDLLLDTHGSMPGDHLYGSMGQTLEKVPDDLVEALAKRSPADVLKLALAWAAHEEVRWHADDATEFLPQLARLAARARSANKSIYLLTSGF